MKTNNRTPRLRFPEFTGEWESPTIAEVFDVRNGYTPSKRATEYWNGGTIPWFRMEDIRENGGILADSFQHITPQAVKGSGLFKKNSIILATTATIGVHAMLIADSLANQRFTNFSIRKSLENKYIPMFVYYAFYGIDEWCKQNTNAGGLLSVNMPALLKHQFLTPSPAEQKKIADCLSEMDALIAAQGDKVEALKERKRGLMQQLFPQQGETTPRLRFPGFTGDWQEKKFTDCFAILRNNTLSRSQLNYQTGKAMNIHYGDILVKFGEVLDIDNKMLPYITDDATAKRAYRETLNNGDIIIADTAEDETVGKCTEIINISDTPVVSGLHTIPLRPLFIFASGYLGYYMNSKSYRAKLYTLMQGVKVTNISRSAIQLTNIQFPPSPAEQEKIAACLMALDELITSESAKLEMLKNHKRGMMQQMFPQPTK